MFQWMPFSLGLVSFGGEPASVPDSLLNAIRRRVDEINAAVAKQLDGLKQGDEVIIWGGPFDGYQAIFDARLSGNERVRVFLNLLEVRQMKIELPANQILPKKAY
jgi:transcriptional antiterminator RfaH